MLDLYYGEWDGTALDADDFVLCADEKTRIQARRRLHSTAHLGRVGSCRSSMSTSDVWVHHGPLSPILPATKLVHPCGSVDQSCRRTNPSEPAEQRLQKPNLASLANFALRMPISLSSLLSNRNGTLPGSYGQNAWQTPLTGLCRHRLTHPANVTWESADL